MQRPRVAHASAMSITRLFPAGITGIANAESKNHIHAFLKLLKPACKKACLGEKCFPPQAKISDLPYSRFLAIAQSRRNALNTFGAGEARADYIVTSSYGYMAGRC